MCMDYQDNSPKANLALGTLLEQTSCYENTEHCANNELNEVVKYRVFTGDGHLRITCLTFNQATMFNQLKFLPNTGFFLSKFFGMKFIKEIHSSLLKKNIERQIKFRTRKMAAAKDLNSNGSLFGRALNIVF